MRIYALLLKHPSGQSLFRAIATIFAIFAATFIILATVSLGQGWIARDQKTNLVNNLFSTPAPDSAYNIEKPVYLSVYDSQFNSKPIKEIGIHKTAQTDSLPAGLTNTPSDDEIWVTPRLKNLIDTTPLLAERYAKYDIKALFPSELAPSPDSLMLLYQIPRNTISSGSSDLQVSSSAQLWNKYSRQNEEDKKYTALRVTLSLLAGIIIITPVLLLVTEITRIGMTQREKRYAALSLIGVTSAQVRLLTVLETLPLSLLGSILGVTIFALIGTPVLAHIPIGDSAIWHSDLILPFTAYATACMAILLCSVLAGLQSIRKVKISPLAVTRTHNDLRKPSVFSIAPLLGGVAGFWIVSTLGKSWYEDNPELSGYTIAGLILAIILGIFLSGPYLTYKLAGILRRISRSASTIMAAYRLRFVYRKEFHSISGIILALFVGVFLMTILATVQATGVKYQASQATASESINPLKPLLQVTIFLPETTSNKSLLKNLEDNAELSNLTSKSYVQKGFKMSSDTEEVSIAGDYYESCSVFKHRTNLPCDKNIDVKSPFIATLQPVYAPGSASNGFDYQFTPVNPTHGTIFDNSYVLVAKDRQSLDRILNIAYNITSNYHRKTNTSVLIESNLINDTGPVETIRGLEGLIMVMLIITITTGGLSLIVNVTGSIFERKQTFLRLRITGASIATLAKSLSVEVFAPLLALSLVVASLGIFTCYYLLSTIGAFSDGRAIFSLPGTVLWVGLGIAIVLSVLTSLITIPLLVKSTNFDEMRSE